MTTATPVNAAWKAHSAKIPQDTSVFWVNPPAGRDYDEIFLGAISNPSNRQFHKCNACRAFLRRYGGLCYLQDGKQVPLFWRPVEGVGQDIKEAHAALHAAVSTGKIARTYYFNAQSPTLGMQFDGGYEHMYYEVPRQLCNNVRAIEAPIREMLNQVLAENPRSTIETAYTLLTNNKLMRAETHKGPIKWLYDLVVKMEDEGHPDKRDLLKWEAIGHAREGFINTLRSGVIAQLLENIRAGKSEAESRALWETLTAPGRYMVATVAPSEGTIAQAEKLCAELGITTNTFQRRLLEQAPDRAVLWSKVPRMKKTLEPVAEEDDFVDIGALSVGSSSSAPPAAPLFAHIKPKAMTPPPHIVKPGDDKPTPISFLGFLNKLKEARRVEYKAGPYVPLYSFVEAAHQDTEDGRLPLMSWHNSQNTASWFTWTDGRSVTTDCKLRVGWNEVSEVLTFPHMWDDAEKFAHRGKRYLFALQGARDNRVDKAGGVLFPENLDGKFHGIRSVITAHNSHPSTKILDDGGEYVCGVSVDVDHCKEFVFRLTMRDGLSNTYSISSFE
jgi:hypothetical protein